MALTATFVRHLGGLDAIYVRRGDGSELTLLVDNADALPGEALHLVVERALSMANGFWGQIDEGSEEPDPDGIRFAEEAVAMFSGGRDGGVAQNYVIPGSYIPAEVVALRTRIVELQEEWAGLPDKGSITLSF